MQHKSQIQLPTILVLVLVFMKLMFCVQASYIETATTKENQHDEDTQLHIICSDLVIVIIQNMVSNLTLMRVKTKLVNCH